MADAAVAINPGAGTLIDTEAVFVGPNEVHRQRTQVTGDAAAEVADVKAAAPDMAAYGLVVRMPGPVGQDFGSVVTPEIGTIYVSGKSRAAIQTAAIVEAMVAGTGRPGLSAVVNQRIYVLQMALSVTADAQIYLRTGTVAGAVKYSIKVLAAGASLVLVAPMGAFLLATNTSEGLWLDCSAATTLSVTFVYAQV